MRKSINLKPLIVFFFTVLVTVPTSKAQDVEPIETVPQLERAIQGTWVSKGDQEYPRLSLIDFQAEELFAMTVTLQSEDGTEIVGGIGSVFDVTSNSVNFSAEMEEVGKEYQCRFGLTNRSMVCGFTGEEGIEGDTHFYVKQ